MPDLVVDGLVKKFGSLVALKQLTFRVREGEIFGFVGANGAGKTTAMRIMLGVLAADRGTVTFAGAPLDFASRRQVGYMPEERGLYPKMRVGDQLTYLAQLHGLSPAAAKAAMEHWTDRLGVAERRGDEVHKLSLGNQQRVQLAAALIHNPSVLVLDEPFSGLDPIAVKVMSEVLIEQAARGVPVIFSSHQLDLVERLCDRVGIIRDGELIACGTISQLRQTPEQTIDITVSGAAPTWSAQLPPAVRVVESDGEHTRVVIAAGDGQARRALVHLAIQAGELQEIRNYYPPLTELYADVMAGGRDNVLEETT
ncbi:MAG: ATP-binding cassette domain-containing protein [Bowdeniella nasicola]|nr:ATP-binding cassette domain-containing protein [Bowdeniella nasicola]